MEMQCGGFEDYSSIGDPAVSVSHNNLICELYWLGSTVPIYFLQMSYKISLGLKSEKDTS